MNIDLASKGFILNPDGSYSKSKKALGTGGVEANRVTASPKAVVATLGTRLISQKPKNPEDKLTKTEQEFLNRLRLGIYGEMDWIGIQSVTLKLGDDCRYTPDFPTMQNGKILFWEVKGKHVWEDSIIKIKTAASQFPFWTFYLCQRNPDGSWQDKIVNQG